MALQPNQKSDASETANDRIVSLRQKIVDLLPPMWRGNHVDMSHITQERIWFLRESHFLFFTRNGPVEITLKPAIVLASALIAMVGVSVIFLSTIFASYSAIEVMRDETIQNAQASVTLAHDDAQRIGALPQDDDEVATWKSDITSMNVLSDQNDEVEGKTATSPEPLPSRFNIQPHVNAPSPTELSGNTVAIQLPDVPQIISGEGQQKTSLAVTLANDFLTADKAVTDPTKIEATNPDRARNKSIMDLASGTTPVYQAPFLDVTSDQTQGQVMEQKDGGGGKGAPPLILPETNSAEYDRTASREKDSFVRTAAGFAVAMLPRLFSEPDHTPKRKDSESKTTTNSGEDAAIGPLDDGFATTTYKNHRGPLLPSVSDAVRAQKMLFSLDGEIRYIRKNIRKLGIKTDNLPQYDTPQTKTQETDFKQLLITLAEHRAALRKIPFKTPMLYFYISSEYGLRKHPKTGKKAFHHGIDLAGTWQENVRSTAPGTVVFAGREGSFGKVVRIEHDYGISTLYAHLSRITVSVGDYVAENKVIGKMGNTGRSAGSHLHYEIQVDGKSVDPSDFFTIGRQISVSGELRQTSFTD